MTAASIDCAEPTEANLTLTHYYVQIQPSEMCVTVVAYENFLDRVAEMTDGLPHKCETLSLSVKRGTDYDVPAKTPFNSNVYNRQSALVVW